MGLKKIWRKIGPEVASAVAAAAAVASGNPQLALPAAKAAGGVAKSTVSKKKPPALTTPIALPEPTGSFSAAYASLSPADREILTVGGAVLGSFLLFRLIAGKGARHA